MSERGKETDTALLARPVHSHGWMCLALCLWHNFTIHKKWCQHPISCLCLLLLSCFETACHAVKPHLKMLLICDWGKLHQATVWFRAQPFSYTTQMFRCLKTATSLLYVYILVLYNRHSIHLGVQFFTLSGEELHVCFLWEHTLW